MSFLVSAIKGLCYFPCMTPWNLNSPNRCGNPEWDGQAFALADPRIPGLIREAAVAFYRPGCVFYFADTDQGGEWWLMCGDDLIEAFWL